MSPSRRTDDADEHLQRWSDRFPDPAARESLVEASLLRMHGLMRHNERSLRELLADDALSYEEFITLHSLLGGKTRGRPATPAALAARTGVTRAGMTSRLDRLAEAGLITRTPDQDDRRRVLVKATRAGRAAWDRTLDAWQELEQSHFRDLSDRELAQLSTILRKVALSTAAD